MYDHKNITRNRIYRWFSGSHRRNTYIVVVVNTTPNCDFEKVVERVRFEHVGQLERKANGQHRTARVCVCIYIRMMVLISLGKFLLSKYVSGISEQNFPVWPFIVYGEYYTHVHVVYMTIRRNHVCNNRRRMIYTTVLWCTTGVSLYIL